MREPWLMRMEWHALAFLHWRVDPAPLRAAVPEQLALDLHDGSGWIGIVPFRMEGVRARWLPPLPTARRFPELNVRTYVRSGAGENGEPGKPGVWFFSLDATSRVAVAAARTLWHLPYFNAQMTISQSGARIHYQSERTHAGAPAGRLRASYGPANGSAYAEALSDRDRFLVERYCLYALDERGRLLRTDIAHPPWRIAAAEADIEVMDLLGIAPGLVLPADPPLAHVAEPQRVVAWRPRRVPAAYE